MFRSTVIVGFSMGMKSHMEKKSSAMDNITNYIKSNPGKSIGALAASALASGGIEALLNKDRKRGFLSGLLRGSMVPLGGLAGGLGADQLMDYANISKAMPYAGSIGGLTGGSLLANNLVNKIMGE